MKNRNFNEVYAKLLKEKNPVLDDLQKRKQILGIGFIVLVVLFYFLMKILTKNFLFLTIYIIVTFFDVAIYITIAGKYKSLYKKMVIANLVKAYSPNLRFNEQYGVPERDYSRANYREYYNRFYSEDLIQGNIDDEFEIKMSEVRTEKEETSIDSEGNSHTEYVTVFRGLFGTVNVRDKMIPYFEVSTNKFFGKYDKSRIEVDSAYFEKNYDLYTEDKIRTMQIFTADLIEEFNQFHQELNSPIQLKVERGTLFFRVSMSNSFEAPTFGKTLDFDMMYHNFQLIDWPIRLISKILENAKDI